MSRYNLEFNKDDSVFRFVIIAFLQDIREKITFKQKTDDVETTIAVPFYYAVTGRESFLYDFFLNDEILDPDNEKAIGIYDQIPRGIVTLNSAEIEASSMVNKFIRATILQKEDGQLKPYSYETSILPIIMNFDIKILSNSNIEMLKITEKTMRKLYKNNTFYVDLGGYRVAGTYAIPESLDSERPFEFGFSDKKTYDITFSIEVKTYLPVFEEGTGVFAGNVMQGIQMEIKDLNEAAAESPYGQPVEPLTGSTDEALTRLDPQRPPYAYPRIESKDPSTFTD